MLNERSQKQKVTYHMVYLYNILVKEIYRDRKQTGISRRLTLEPERLAGVITPLNLVGEYHHLQRSVRNEQTHDVCHEPLPAPHNSMMQEKAYQ